MDGEFAFVVTSNLVSCVGMVLEIVARDDKIATQGVGQSADGEVNDLLALSQTVAPPPVSRTV